VGRGAVGRPPIPYAGLICLPPFRQPPEDIRVIETAQPLDPSLRDDGISVAEDFYHHVNARWLAANPVPAEYPMWGAYIKLDHDNKELTRRLLEEAAAAGSGADPITRLVGDYYAAGMDEAAIAAAGVEPIRAYLDRIDALASVADVRALALDLHRAGAGPLFGIGVEADFEDADVYLAYLGQAGLGLPERGYYTNDDERSVALRAAYVAHVAAQLVNLGATPDMAAAAAETNLAWERRLADVSLSREQQRDPLLTMNRFEVDALDELMPGLRLGAYLREVGVAGDTACVDNPGFFRELDAALAETPIETLRVVLRWHLVRACASSLSPAFEDENFAFYGRTLGGQQAQQPRWKRVVAAADADVGEAVARLYVAVAFPPEAKARCEELVRHLLHAMERAIRGNDWMTEPTREQALAKLAGFGYKIGYPSTWRDYSALRLDRSSFVGNRMAAAAFEMRRQLARLGAPMDPTEWAMPAHVVNAYYHPLRNEVVFPAGILQPPFFYADADDPVNYGGIGTVIGHEITHGFDDTGSRFDAAGALRDWWTEEDRAEFERRANVLVEQFDGYAIADDVHVNGKLTLGENIADLGGIAISFDAMHEAIGDDAHLVDGLTAEQRFFLAYATMWRMGYTEAAARMLANVDTHSPSQYRVNGPLSDFPPFATAFGIPDGSPMVRSSDLRAKIW
jgi:putative endopeptidase